MPQRIFSGKEVWMSVKLRIIHDFGRTGSFNMAADLHALSECARTSQIILRFYTWTPSAISLGCMQNPEGLLDTDALAEANISWVRRVTGGRAVLHKGDLTYSCTFSQDIVEMGKSITESYSLISSCLRKGLTYLNVITQAHDSPIDSTQTRREIKLPCFVAPNRDEIMINDRKVVGSAQKRTERAVLQHGSIPITDECYELPNYLLLSPEERTRSEALLRKKSIPLSECVPSVNPQGLAEHLVRGFCDALTFAGPYQASWTPDEEKSILSLAKI